MHVIVIASGKGGTGKTTTALALAAAFHARGLVVDLVDLDPQGGATWAAGLDVNALPPGAGAAAVIEGRPVDAARQTSAEGFGVFAGSADLLRVEGRVDVHTLRRFGSTAAGVLVIDTPPGVGRFTQAAAALADRIVVPLQAEPAASHTLPHILALLGAVKARGKLAGVVLCMVPARALLTSAQRDEVAALAPILGDVPRSIAVAESVNAGQSVIGYAPKSPAALAYIALADELWPPP